ncbi:MAG: aminotransferase class IV [Armatimonadota bacterium]
MSALYRWGYLNGSILPATKPAVALVDRGFLFGYGLFETIRVQDRECVRFSRHMNRLADGAKLIGLDNLPAFHAIKEAISSLIEANDIRNARIRLTVTGGISPTAGITFQDTPNPSLAIVAYELPDTEPPPARVIISTIRRDEQNPLSSVKSLNYLPSILALREARRKGADDAVMLNTRGHVAEGTMGNIFLRFGHTLITPSLDDGLVPGTVRAAVVEHASELGFQVAEKVVTPDELTHADEAFFTNAIQLIRPIREINGTVLKNSSTALVKQLREALTKME